LVAGNAVDMRLAERGTLLGTKKNERVWVREIRRLMPGGHQTSVISTDYKSDIGRTAATMFARWCQENFFKYMRQNFGIDRLVSYELEDIPADTQVVNPKYRELDGTIRKAAAVLSRKIALFGATKMAEDIETTPTADESKKKTDLHLEIVALQAQIDGLKADRKQTANHIEFSELPAEQRFKGLSTGTKQLLDTVKMVAYRAETAMAHILQEKMSRSDDSRSLLQAIYATEADLLPDIEHKLLRVRLHSLANRSSDDAVARLCKELNDTETIFPGTELRLFYESTPTKNRPASPVSSDVLPLAGIISES
jgi:hypothetical protein